MLASKVIEYNVDRMNLKNAPNYFVIVAADDAIVDGLPVRGFFPFMSETQFQELKKGSFQASGCDMIKPISTSDETAVIVVVHRVKADTDFDTKILKCVGSAFDVSFGSK